ncbi:glycosyl hydrolase 2 galactose-binding domain-containing protein [Peteryoungia ipomoeae]|uniref:Glycoside hydrolase family 2 protein n=1 Tax=Peteryoungia ipomoeae TaxID=1210932 RepID=A0A4S8NSC6_9HYPH|nr:glycoside hydrolase family 2 protein [Peteryoungia ipomoeae]THV20280.1 glycoside hydrolase family 2 protein [Peteryoungia ipomoeae]
MSTRIYLGADVRPLEQGWTLLVTEAGRHEHPFDAHRPAARIPATVPGTVAGALADAGLFDPAAPTPLHDKDVWYFRSLEGEAAGPALLRFEGLATVAEVYVNGRLMLESDSMFEAHDVSLELTGRDDLAICFRALETRLNSKGPRARWRPQMMDHQALRLVRTTVLGHMPGWCPSIHPMGPYRSIQLIRPGRDCIRNLRVSADLDASGTGHLSVRFDTEHGPRAALRCCGVTTELVAGPDGSMQADIVLPDVEPWWPRTHGKPKLHALDIAFDGRVHSLGLIGFRRIEIDRGADGKGFGLKVNGVRVFCRGAVWTNADILRLSGSGEAYAPWLIKAAEANMNMIRIGGTMTYETKEFFGLCDQLGLLVWQDMMFANYDYPVSNPDFLMQAKDEAKSLLGQLQGHPSLAVVCGGSEVFQQGAMLGLKPDTWNGAFFNETLATIAAEMRPDAAYVPNSPFGGAMPFAPSEGVTHYYGVGAYQRPLEDARRAEVRFAAECLAFANVPQQETLDRHLPVPPVHDPRWKARVPRDRAASWDFEDIRDHYLQLLYGHDPARLRREDPSRYLAYSRATTTEIVTEAYAEWRRKGSSCNGALVWTLQDLEAGPGWGVIDATGEPKSVWYGLKRAFRPVQISLTDEGTNGLMVHVLNDSAATVETTVSLTCLRDGRHPAARGTASLTLSAHSWQALPATDLFGAFFDTTYAFRFGPPSHDVTVAELHSPDGDRLADAYHFPLGRSQSLHAPVIEHRLEQQDGNWVLILRSDVFAQSLHVACENYRVEEDWFHLPPGQWKPLRLLPREQDAPAPRGTVQSLGSRGIYAWS